MTAQFFSKPRLLAAALAGAGMLLSGSALAEQGIKFLVGTGVTFEDNVFRLDSGVSPALAAGTSRSDHYFDTFAGLKAETLLGRQVLSANVLAKDRRYSKYDDFNFNGIDLGGRWDWVLGNSFKGIARIDRTENLTAFADTGGDLIRNKLTMNSAEVGARYWMLSDWHLMAGAGRVETRNSFASRSPYDANSNWWEAGVEYLTGSENVIQLVSRQTKGDYAAPVLGSGLVKDNYTQRDVQLRSTYKFGGSSLSGQIGHSDRSVSAYTANDFTGITGRLAFDWVLSPKSSVLFTVARELGTYPDLVHAYAVTNLYSIVPTWKITPKVSVQAMLEQRKRKFRPNSAREDDFSLYGVGLTWDVMRSLQATFRYTRDERDSTLLGFDYKANVYYLGARLEF